MLSLHFVLTNIPTNYVITWLVSREMMDMEPLYWLMTLNSLASPWVYLAFNWNLLCLGRLRRGSNSDTQL